MERKIPTLFGLLLLVGLVTGVIFVFERLTHWPSRATGSIEPRGVTFTNISETAFTVTWMTAVPTTGMVTVSSPQPKTATAFDERDSAGKLGTYTTHSVPIQNIEANTEYSVKLVSNGKTFLDSGKPFIVKSAPPANGNPSGLEPAYGTVMTPTNQPAQGALVYLTVEGGQTLSALVSQSGAWLIPLNLVRTASLAQYVAPAPRLTETIRVVGDDQEATAMTDTVNDAPVPLMILGKTYDFRKIQGKAPEALAEAPTTGSTLGAQAQPPLKQTFSPSLTSPAEGAQLPTTLPLVEGTGIPGQSVSVVLGITDPIGGTTVVGSDGVWRFTPTRQLAPGKQSVTATTVDQNGSPVAITHGFTLFKSGTQVLGQATPSATLTPTLTPTPTSTLAGQPVPESGTTLPTLLLIIFGLGLLTSGAVVFIK